MLSQGLPGKYGWGVFGGSGGVSGLRLGCGFARSFVEFALLSGDQRLVREVLMHPRKMVVAGLHDSLGVPQWDVLLFEIRFHQRRVGQTYVRN
jgi:hypothetical protein